MNKKLLLNLQMFAEENITKSADIAPAISIDHVSRLHTNIKKLMEVLGITEMIPMNEGTNIKIYKFEQENTPEQVAEGEKIGLTKIKRVLARTIEISLKKFRRNTTAEAIQKSGKDAAINQTDEKLVGSVQKGIKKNFYDVLATGTGEASGKNLQSALAAAWGALQKVYEDEDVTPIHFVSSDDLAEYLGNATVSMQQAFGLSYIADFLGLGTVVVSPTLPKGKTIATAKENLNCAYVPANTGDLAKAFNLTSDASGLVGMGHYVVSETATIDTLVMAGVEFYPELLDGVIVSTISATGA